MVAAAVVLMVLVVLMILAAAAVAAAAAAAAVSYSLRVAYLISNALILHIRLYTVNKKSCYIYIT